MSAYGCEFIGNSAGETAGAVYLYNGTVSDSFFSNNWAAATGGALLGSQSSISVVGSRFVNNSAATGGAVGSYTGRSISDSAFIGNVATNGNAGAIDNAIAYRCVFEGNRATGTGAAAYGASINDCLVISNQALQAKGYIVTATATAPLRAISALTVPPPRPPRSTASSTPISPTTSAVARTRTPCTARRPVCPPSRTASRPATRATTPAWIPGHPGSLPAAARPHGMPVWSAAIPKARLTSPGGYASTGLLISAATNTGPATSELSLVCAEAQENSL
jgi:hypothetical protein